jgi:hypothetical protein
METKEVKAANETVNNNDKKQTPAATNMRPNIAGKDKSDENSVKNTAQATPAAPSQTPAPAASVAASPAKAETTEPVKTAEPTKKELKAELQETKTRGLEDTVKLVEQLGKKIAQKNKLFNTVSNLDTFVVSQNDDKDDASADSKFLRCELVISDDDNNEFVTKNPYIISRVVDMVKQLCIEKLAEVEATIVIP